MTTKVKVIIGAVAIVVAFAVGRYSGPEKIKVETKIVTVEKDTKTDTSDTQDHKKITIVDTTKPDGTKTKTTTIVDDKEAQDTKTETDQTTTKESQTTEITKGSNKVLVSGLIARNLSSFASPIYGASISKPILGPLYIGAFGLTDKTIGVSIGLMF